MPAPPRPGIGRGELRNLHLSHRLLIGGASVALLVLQFGSYRRPAIIGLPIPLILVGTALGLLVFSAWFDFVAMLGVFSLAGIIIAMLFVAIVAAAGLAISSRQKEQAATATATAQAIVYATQTAETRGEREQTQVAQETATQMALALMADITTEARTVAAEGKTVAAESTAEAKVVATQVAATQQAQIAAIQATADAASTAAAIMREERIGVTMANPGRTMRSDASSGRPSPCSVPTAALSVAAVGAPGARSSRRSASRRRMSGATSAWARRGPPSAT